MKTTKPPLTREQRRLRRIERRERERERNVLRAVEMRAARLAAAKRPAVVAGLPDVVPPRWNVGCSGWFYWEWKDTFYPPGLSSRDWFSHYADQFDTVELNAPFYNWPTVATVKSWLRQAGDRRFFYSVKVCDLITHVKRFTGVARLVQDFGYIGDLLGSRLGCFLFQLPPSFHYSAARLKRILDRLDPSRRNVVEFRHASWWNRQTFRAFERTNTIFCSCSGPRLPDDLVQTSDEVYIRFHGTSRWYRHDYTAEELAVWTARIRESRPARVWAYFNNDHGCNAIRNARELLRQLKDVDA